MKKAVFIPVLIMASFLCHAAWAAPFKAVAVVERTDIFPGQPLIFQIQVSGSENPDRPDLSPVTDFAVTFKGGRQNSRRSVTIINGKVTRDVRAGYFFSYQLIPKREGQLTIPAITVTANGQSTQTDPVVIHVRRPVESDDFKLRLHLSQNRCYLGEPVILTVTWYLGKDVKDFNFSLPLIDNDAFVFDDVEADTGSGKNRLHIPIGNETVIGEKGRGRIKDKDYTTLTFKKVLIPVKPGKIDLKPATVSCSALVGYQKQPDMFDDDFFNNFFNNDFFGSQRGVYKTVVVPSNTLSLEVLDLPEAGRPLNFSGLVGGYKIEARAEPTQVNMGDPITLTVSVSGPEYLKGVRLPLLSRQPELAKRFKIPKEQATGQISGQKKIFTQTLRALSPDVKEIPPIELSYFDPRSKTYKVARTAPIPLTVKQTRMITAADAEGNAIPQAAPGSEIQTLSQGIAFNYEDLGVIADQRLSPLSWARSPLWLGLILGPPFCYLLLLTAVGVYRRRNADPAAAQAKRAYSRLLKSLPKAKGTDASDQTCIRIQDAFRSYLGDKLDMAKGALTFNDVKTKLAQRGVEPDVLKRLQDLFDQCEAARYAQGADLPQAAAITEQAAQLAKDLEKKLK